MDKPSRPLSAVVIAFGMVVLCAGTVWADGTDKASGSGAALNNCTTVSPDESPALKPKKPLGSFIKDYAKEYDPKMDEEEKPIVERQDALKGATFDEKEYYKGKTESGYKKTKEDFVDPKGVMTK